MLLFSLGLSITVAPLTAAILAGVDQDEAGIGSAVNNAVARVAGLIATVAVGALVAAQFSSSLDRHLTGAPLTPRGQAAVAQAKRLTLGRPSVAGSRRAKRRRSPSHRTSPRSGLPRRHRRRRRARHHRRADRRRGDPQPPPRRPRQANAPAGSSPAPRSTPQDSTPPKQPELRAAARGAAFASAPTAGEARGGGRAAHGVEVFGEGADRVTASRSSCAVRIVLRPSRGSRHSCCRSPIGG